MSSRNTESLSALLDNEADELELRRLLKDMEQAPDLADTWARMSLVQAVLHDDNLRQDGWISRPNSRLARSVAAAIARETTPAKTGFDLSRWSRPLARAGIAAAVAMAFFVGVQTDLGQPPVGNLPVAQQSAPAVLETGTVTASQMALAQDSSARSVQQVDPAAMQRLEEYIRSVSITRDEPAQLEQLQDSPLYRLVNEIRD